MAKRSTMAFALPVEEMRGKLATKQQEITYQGQGTDQTPYDLAAGKKSANNFHKYFVGQKRNNKQFFYVKSRTSINNTAPMKAAKAALGSAGVLFDKAERLRDSWRDCYNYALNHGFKGTFREWAVSVFINGLRNKATAFSAPYGSGMTRTLGQNTFNGATSSPMSFDYSLFQKFVKVLGFGFNTIKIVDIRRGVDGTTVPVVFAIQSAASTWAQFSTQDNHYGPVSVGLTEEESEGVQYVHIDYQPEKGYPLTGDLYRINEETQVRVPMTELVAGQYMLELGEYYAVL